MSPEFWGIIGIGAVLVLIFFRMPVGFVMALVGVIGIWLMKGAGPALSIIASEPYAHASDYILSVVPLFVFMGYLAGHTRLSADAFYALNKWIGHFRGGLAMVTEAVSAVFGAITAEPIASAVAIGPTALPELRKYNYDDRLSVGVIASGSNLGFLIPPSLGFIIYGILTELSIGTLFISGILPGLLMAALSMITIYILCRISPRMAAPGPKAGWMERFKALPRIIGVAVVIVLVLGGIYTGVFTPTEAGAVGTFVMLVLTTATRQLSWRGFRTTISKATLMTGMVFILIIGAMIFNRFLVVAEVPLTLANFVAGLDLPPFLILVVVLVFFILIGFIMDTMAILIVAVPILHPLLVGLGFDPIWLAVLILITVLIGGITPPVGLLCFALSGIFRDIPLFTIFRGAFPFVGTMLVCLILIIAFPQIALWLPNMMR